jgi:hypothetical protein
VLIIALYKYILQISLITNNYLPVWSDEFGYYLNAYSFYVNNTLDATFTFNGSGALLVGADAHGFMYPLFHGIIAKVFGWNNLNIVITNLFILFLSATLIFNVKAFSNFDKLFFALLVIIYPLGCLYSFTFMQETIQVLFSVLASIQLFFIYCEKDSKRNILLYVLIVLLAASFRPTWIFALIALIPNSKSKKDIIVYSIIFIVGVLLGFVYAKYFFEPVPDFFVEKLLDEFHTKGILSFSIMLLGHLIFNLKCYFSFNESIVYYFLKISIICLGFIITIATFTKKDKILVAFFLLYAINISSLFLFYDAFSWREIRFLSPLFYLTLILSIIYLNDDLKITLLLIVLFMFLKSPIDEFTSGRNKFTVNELTERKKEMNKVFDKIELSEEVIVLVDFKPSDYSLDLLSLPLRNNQNTRIKYIIPYYNSKRTHYDYILKKDKSIIKITKLGNVPIK